MGCLCSQCFHSLLPLHICYHSRIRDLSQKLNTTDCVTTHTHTEAPCRGVDVDYRTRGAGERRSKHGVRETTGQTRSEQCRGINHAAKTDCVIAVSGQQGLTLQGSNRGWHGGCDPYLSTALQRNTSSPSNSSLLAFTKLFNNPLCTPTPTLWESADRGEDQT